MLTVNYASSNFKFTQSYKTWQTKNKSVVFLPKGAGMKWVGGQ